jgi:hypothetical protein
VSEDDTSTEVDSDEETTSTDDDDDSSSSDSSESGSEFSSGTNTECEFTDSEGKPNPFHKELEVPKIVIEPGSPVASARRKVEASKVFPSSKYVDQRIGLENRERSEPSLSSLTYTSRLQYKTPNLSGRLQTEEVKQTGYVTRSTQRALSLKKNWVSDAPAAVTTGKKSSAAELDSRLKSLMERLSNQQSLLKPAEKHSSQMEHLLKNSPSSRVITTTTTFRDPVKLKSPPPSSQGGGITQGTGMTAYHFYPSPYQASTTSTDTPAVTATTTIYKSETLAPLTEEIESTKLVDKPTTTKGFTEVERLLVPDKSEEAKIPSCDSTSSETTSSDSSSESTQSENLSPQPPPIPPAPLMVPDILIHTDTDLLLVCDETKNYVIGIDNDLPETIIIEPEAINENLDQSSDSIKDEFESCLEDQEVGNKSSDLNYHTPVLEIESPDCNNESIKEDIIILNSPLATSSPLVQTPEKEPVIIKVCFRLIFR